MSEVEMFRWNLRKLFGIWLLRSSQRQLILNTLSITFADISPNTFKKSNIYLGRRDVGVTALHCFVVMEFCSSLGNVFSSCWDWEFIFSLPALVKQSTDVVDARQLRSEVSRWLILNLQIIRQFVCRSIIGVCSTRRLRFFLHLKNDL